MLIVFWESGGNIYICNTYILHICIIPFSVNNDLELPEIYWGKIDFP